MRRLVATIAVSFLILLPSLAPTSSAVLSENSRLGFFSPDADQHRREGLVSAEPQQDSAEACRLTAAECVVAPSGNLVLDTARSWGRPGTLADHFARHGADFGAQTADEYAGMASKFLQEAQARGLPTKVGPDGAIRIYDPATNTFGSFNANGTTRTFYKPNPAQHGYPTNPDYWNAQPGGAPWTP